MSRIDPVSNPGGKAQELLYAVQDQLGRTPNIFPVIRTEMTLNAAQKFSLKNME